MSKEIRSPNDETDGRRRAYEGVARPEPFAKGVAEQVQTEAPYARGGQPIVLRYSAMRRILLVIPISAVIIAGLMAFKLTRHYEPRVEESATDVRPAPVFQLYDQHSQIVRLARYVG